jgi:isoleucyl-tRNA synthetase
VHNAPGFGEDDYLACKKYNIAPYSPINHLGKFTTEINDTDLVGLFYDDANKVITEKLTKAGSLLHLSFFTHSAAID